MIQRKQTLWLLLAALCSIAGLKLSFFYVSPLVLTGQLNNGVIVEINGMTNLWLNVFSISTGVLSLLAVFLFQNRKLQIRICLVGLLTELLVILGYYQTIKTYAESKPALGLICQILIVASLLLAIGGIRKDEKIIAESDRLR